MRHDPHSARAEGAAKRPSRPARRAERLTGDAMTARTHAGAMVSRDTNMNEPE